MTIINLLYILVYHANPGVPGLECLLVLIGFFGCAALYSLTRSIPNRLAISSPPMPSAFQFLHLAEIRGLRERWLFAILLKRLVRFSGILESIVYRFLLFGCRHMLFM